MPVSRNPRRPSAEGVQDGRTATATRNDRAVLRDLASQVAQIAAQPCHAQTAELWARLNDLHPVRPMVRIYQIPWREMDVDAELPLVTGAPQARQAETQLRRTLYLWRHMPADMVVEPRWNTPIVVRNSGYGIDREVDVIPHDSRGGICAQRYHSQLQTEDDVEKIRMPVLSADPDATESRYAWACEVFDGLLEVHKQGRQALNYSPWDRLSEWCAPDRLLMDLIERPAFLHRLVDRLVTAYGSEMDQLEALGALSVSRGNHGVGQGGLGYTRDLPQPDCNGQHVRLRDIWGGSMAQIFAVVSPAMHEEFALRYEKRLLDRFGLTYYGCCEPLHNKVDVIARNVPNLRKISMSPWVDARRGAEAVAGRFVFSFKPNPAFLATDGRWDRHSAEKELRGVLDVTAGQSVELILKDISTVRFEPRRLWAWAEMAGALAQEAA
jgi:hypothetical protein